MLYFKREIKTVCIGILITDVIVLAASVFMGAFSFSVIIGAVFGSVFSCLKFMLLITAVINAVLRQPEKAKSYMTLQYFIRFILTAAALAIAASADYINFIAAAAPMISVRISVSFLPLVYKNEKGGADE